MYIYVADSKGEIIRTKHFKLEKLPHYWPGKYINTKESGVSPIYMEGLLLLEITSTVSLSFK